jgi:hypothetical protein
VAVAVAIQRKLRADIMAMCAEQGATVTQGNSKIRVKCPSGAVVSLHTTPKDHTAWVNMTRQALTRAGITWTLSVGKGAPSQTTGRKRRSAKEGNTP